MSATIHGGPLTKSASRDSEGHRLFKITHLVRTTSKDDGPKVVMDTPGLPVVGSIWDFGNDSCLWAFCQRDMEVKIHKEKRGDPAFYWEVSQKFSTKPTILEGAGNLEDPLLESQKVSGSFVKYTKEVTKDRYGDLIESSSHEPIPIEFDHNRPTVRIEQNVASLELATFSEMVDTVNDDILWGLGVRRIKLSDVSWERKGYGLDEVYYTRIFDFDIDFNTFDVDIPDRGRLVLKGKWTNVEADPTWVVDEGMNKDKPTHFMRAIDPNENVVDRILLDGDGEPLVDGANPHMITVRHYGQSDFLLLGIPTSL